jgi:hypothetical protein
VVNFYINVLQSQHKLNSSTNVHSFRFIHKKLEYGTNFPHYTEVDEAIVVLALKRNSKSFKIIFRKKLKKLKVKKQIM